MSRSSPSFLKVVFFLIPVTLFTSVSSHAQFHVLRGIDEIEILGGPSLVTFGGEDWESNKIKIGYSAGLGAAWKLKEKSAIVVKLLSERKGIKFSYETTYFDDDMQQHTGKVTRITNLNYLTVPITFRYFFDPRNQFLVEIGAYISYLYKAQAVTESSWRSKDVYNRKNDFTEFDSGLSLLIGYTHPFNNNISIKFWVNGGYGLVKIGDESGATGFLNVHNETLGIGVSLVKHQKVTNE